MVTEVFAVIKIPRITRGKFKLSRGSFVPEAAKRRLRNKAFVRTQNHLKTKKRWCGFGKTREMEED